MSPGPSSVAAFLRREVEEGSFPGGAALIGSGDAILDQAVAGAACVDPEHEAADAETLYDLASLTKPLAAAALTRAAGAALPLDAAPGRFLPEWKRTRFEGITVASLLTHTSGLAAWFPLYARGEGAASYRRTLSELEPEAAPGAAVVYSDLNFLLLAQLLESVLSAPIDRAFEALVAVPAGSSARFLPDSPERTAARSPPGRRRVPRRRGRSKRTGPTRGAARGAGR